MYAYALDFSLDSQDIRNDSTDLTTSVGVETVKNNIIIEETRLV